jgi:crossover junction endodeoxyribonuclease RuvC
MKQIVGLDIALTATGIAHGRTCKTLGRDGITKLPFHQRMVTLQMLAWLIIEEIPPAEDEDEPGLAVVELPNMAMAAGGQLERSILWWEVIRNLSLNNYEVACPTQSQRLKFLTGKGSGTKGTVIEQVTRRWPEYELGGDDNRADAVVYYKMGVAQLGGDVGLPQSYLTVLDKVEWPEGI